MSITLQEIVDILRMLPTEDKDVFLNKLAQLADADVDHPRCPSCGSVPEMRRLPEEILVPSFVCPSPGGALEPDVHSAKLFEIACKNASCAFSPKTRDPNLKYAEEMWRQAILIRWENDLLIAKADRDLKVNRALAERSPGGAP